MAEIILSTRDESDQALRYMPREVVDSILEKIVPLKPQQILLHADWTEPPEYSDWLFSRLREHHIQATICIDSIESIPSIKKFNDESNFVELCLNRTNNGEPSENLNGVSGLKFFLPVNAISQDASLYDTALDRITSPCKMTLGINWQSRLSGPGPIPEDDYSAWADTIIALVDKLNAKKVQVEIACGLKLCMFTREQLGYLPTRLVNWPLAYCAHSFFFKVDGTLQPCMRLHSTEAHRFSHKSDINSAAEDFENWLTPYTGHCMDSEDLDCRSLKTRGCGTGCPEHTISEWLSS